MHELSIALSIVDECSREAIGRGSARVETVYLKLGRLSGVVQEALRFSFDLACEGTLLEGCNLVIEEIPVVVFCPDCQAERELISIQRFCCPACDLPTAAVVKGRELEIVAIEIVPDDAADSAAELEEVAR